VKVDRAGSFTLGAVAVLAINTTDVVKIDMIRRPAMQIRRARDVVGSRRNARW